MHIYLSVFFLPMALIFVITGIFYLFGFKQDYGMQTQRFEILQKQPILNLEAFVLDFLKQNHLELPKNTQLQPDKDKFKMGSPKYFISVWQDQDRVQIQTNRRSFYGNLVMLHKGKVGKAFQAFSMIFGVALFVFYFSGFIMTSWCKQHRKSTFFSLLLGLFVTSLIAYISL